MEDRILVVTHSADMRDLLVPFLAQSGCKVSTAVDGRGALLRLGLCHPQLIILDMALPGLDSWETLQRIRELSDVPVIAFTGPNQETKLDSLRQGADYSVSCPFSMRELEARVYALLRRVEGTVLQPAGNQASST